MSTVSIQRASTPTPVTRSLYSYMNDLYSKIAERAYNLFEAKGRIHGYDLEDWLNAEAEFLAPMPLELSETDTELMVRAEVPGFDEKNIEIVVEPERLFITGKTANPIGEIKRKKIYTEVFLNEIFRTIALPVKVEPERASAVLKNGILGISMRKAKATTAEKVIIMSAAA